MRAVLDACVLYPPVMREALLVAARQGLFEPLWSDRILAEWLHVAARDGAVNKLMVEGEIALLKANWPSSGLGPVADSPDLWLPDPADIHVLAAARAGDADVIVTLNLKDFPRRELDPFGLVAVHPDAFLHRFSETDDRKMADALRALDEKAAAHGDAAVDLGALLKRAKLPRLAKFWRRVNPAG